MGMSDVQNLNKVHAALQQLMSSEPNDRTEILEGIIRDELGESDWEFRDIFSLDFSRLSVWELARFAVYILRSGPLSDGQALTPHEQADAWALSNKIKMGAGRTQFRWDVALRIINARRAHAAEGLVVDYSRLLLDLIAEDAFLCLGFADLRLLTKRAAALLAAEEPAEAS
jgi:hypothetical protein